MMSITTDYHRDDGVGALLLCNEPWRTIINAIGNLLVYARPEWQIRNGGGIRVRAATALSPQDLLPLLFPPRSRKKALDNGCIYCNKESLSLLLSIPGVDLKHGSSAKTSSEMSTVLCISDFQKLLQGREGQAMRM
jgi:hypothetical protein